MEYIRCEKWGDLADVCLDFRNNPNKQIFIPKQSCIIYFNTEYADIVFDTLNKVYEKSPELRFILISAQSDCGICYQKDNAVADDMHKAFYMIDMSKLGYEPIKLEPRCMTDRCNINHKFSVKMYAFTFCTFEKIPPNVIKWYTTNNDTKEEKIQSIPFGIPHWFESVASDKFIVKIGELPNNRTYMAFQANTMERYSIINSYNTDEKTLVRRQEVPHKQYVDDMLSCGFVLSPSGNGIDCFRTLETLYLGRIPIIPKKLKECYNGLPVMTPGGEDDVDYLNFSLENTVADKTFWRNEISKQKELL